MKEWLLFIIFMFVGSGLLISGVRYMQKEKNDPESVRMYRVISAIGAVIVLISILVKFVF